MYLFQIYVCTMYILANITLNTSINKVYISEYIDTLNLN